MANKYWGADYSDLIHRVRAWNDLENGTYDEKRRAIGKLDFEWYDFTEAQLEAKIDKVQEDFSKYFYCPICRRKTLLNDAVVRRKMMDSSIKLDPALMPGWWKIKASADYCYIRVCPSCSDKEISWEALSTAFDSNAIETRKGKIKAANNSAANSGCMVLFAVATTLTSLSCWGLFLLFGI